ncbi:MAG: hemolysin family protein [Phycisphaerae bacterium]|nr:HlyC/CorC family transporter [Phycisphaerae bacterium]MCZ2400852.1 hemolysin family protein [Phycisphaerae bacterium]
MLSAVLLAGVSAAPSADAAGVAGTLVLIGVLLALSGVFSASEAVLFSLTPLQLQSNAQSGNPLRRLSAVLMREPKRALTVILVGNTSVNVALFAATYVLTYRLVGDAGPWVAPLLGLTSVLAVLICGETVPKVLGVTLADRLAPWCAGVVNAAGYVLGPVGRVIDLLLVVPLTRLLEPRGREEQRSERDVTHLELKTLLEMSRQHGVIDPIETDFLREVINLSVLQVRDVMVPRVEVQLYDVNAGPEGLRELMQRTRRRKIPVYDGAIDNIVGLIYAKVLFFSPERPLRELVQPVRFVPELITCEQLLQHFRSTRSQLAIVVDEYGGMAGLVTLEDVIEQIVGEIRGPDEPAGEPEIVPVADGEYDVSGRLSARYWAETFGAPDLAERVTTVGGLVTARLGRPARVGDTVRIGNVELRVTRTRRRRVERLRLVLRGDAAEDRPPVPAGAAP